MASNTIVYQNPLLVLHDPITKVQVYQNPLLVLHDPITSMRIFQSALLILHDEVTEALQTSTIPMIFVST